MLALQSRESLLRTGIWTIAHAICAGMSRLLPREERQKAENALRSLTGQLIAVSDDAAVPETNVSPPIWRAAARCTPRR